MIDGAANMEDACGKNAAVPRAAKAMKELTSLLRHPQRTLPLVRRLVGDQWQMTFEPRHLYSYATAGCGSRDTLDASVRWILDAQRPDGGIAAYYSLLTGYSESYPEVTGYLIPTLYDFASLTKNHAAVAIAERATRWLLSLQTPIGAFPGGLHGGEVHPSVFNTGQILHGLVRAHRETNRPEIWQAALRGGDWLVDAQQPDGSWSGSGVYQETSHTYYSMVAWALAELCESSGQDRYGLAAEKNLDWVLTHVQPSGWIEGINLQGHPIYLHFIAYVLQGILECAILRQRNDAIETVAKSAWVLLKKFETNKVLSGTYEPNFTCGGKFTCLTGNAQMSCVWLRLFEVTDDPRYLNAGLKMNEMLKHLTPRRGAQGIAGGVSGSYPIWGRYQPLRYVSWGSKFFADAILLEQRLTRSFEASAFEALPCAS